MSNYTKTTDFAAKDSLPSGHVGKVVKGTEIDTEFNNIAIASATKANANNAALTGTSVFETLSDGTLSVTGWVDEDNMASNSNSLIPTQQSVKAYVDSNVTAQDLDVTDGSSSIDIDLDSESLGILGGTGVTSTASGTGVTLAIDSTVATLTGSQTLTNKTLTTPTILTSFTIGSATITEAELEILDGATVTTAELNVLDGITSTTAELNILDGVTSTAAELNILDGVTSTAAELNILDGVTSTTAELNILDGVTSTASELNILDGVTSTATELNILDGVTATTAEINYVDGVTSNVQTQINTKAPIAGATFTGTTTIPTADINGGAIDGTVIGGSTAAAGSFTTVAASSSLTIGGVTSVPFEAADHSKLDGIEASADVTDATNVTAAGALMDSELTSIASVKAMNQGVATSNSPTFAGITTSGITNTANLKISGAQGTDGQILTSTGSGVAWEDAAGGGGGGAYEVISSQTISSGVSTVNFQNVFTSTYDTYELHLVGVTGTAAIGLYYLNGSTPIASSNNYGRVFTYQSGSSSLQFAYGNNSYIGYWGSSTQVMFSKMIIRSPLSTAGNSFQYYFHAQDTSNVGGNTPAILTGSETGRNKSGTAANGVQLWGNTNGITGGKITLYGIKTS